VPATRTASRISFHLIHEPSGKRIRYEKVVPGLGSVAADLVQLAGEPIDAKLHKRPPREIDEAPPTSNVINLMDALKRSDGGNEGRGSGKARRKPAAKPRARVKSAKKGGRRKAA
jgi:non-homologous end joining protein Ku